MEVCFVGFSFQRFASRKVHGMTLTMSSHCCQSPCDLIDQTWATYYRLGGQHKDRIAPNSD